jgi:hypothetical protein
MPSRPTKRFFLDDGWLSKEEADLLDDCWLTGEETGLDGNGGACANELP